MQPPQAEPPSAVVATSSSAPSFASSDTSETRGVRALVVANAPEVEGVRRLSVSPSGPWRFSTGQVAELSAGQGTEGYFAIATAPGEGGPLVFLIKAEGSGSELLMRLPPGGELTLRGPLGRGFALPSASDAAALLFVTAGTAIAAVRSAVAQALLIGDAARVSIVVGVRRLTDLCFAEELGDWQRRGVDVCVCVSGEVDPAAGASQRFAVVRGRVQQHLGPRVRATTRAFIAGSEALEDDVTAALGRLGVASDRIQRNYRPDRRALG